MQICVTFMMMSRSHKIPGRAKREMVQKGKSNQYIFVGPVQLKTTAFYQIPDM